VKFEANGDIGANMSFVVKDADLIINSNIEYGATDYSNPNNIPSAACIVINGNIIIDNDVTRIDCILMAVDTENNGRGKVTNMAVFDPENLSNNPLVINGSLMGDVHGLFSTRIWSGNPERDEGAVTIRYDERLLLNIPVIIREFGIQIGNL